MYYIIYYPYYVLFPVKFLILGLLNSVSWACLLSSSMHACLAICGHHGDLWLGPKGTIAALRDDRDNRITR